MSTKKIVIYIILTILIILPFFWLKTGQVNLGGDSSRLYFYQPWLFIGNYLAYSITPLSFGYENIGYFIIPYSAFLGILLTLVKSPHNLINVMNSLILGVSFLATYGAIYRIINDADRSKKNNKSFARTVAVIGALFYIFAPNMTNWDKPLVTFNRTFLDPLIFFLLYLFFTKKNFLYLLIIIILTFIFSPNFSFDGAPTAFAFYPLAIIYILVITVFLRQDRVPIKQLFSFFFLFIGIQSFQMIPQLLSFLNTKSDIYTRVFDSGKLNYVNYFLDSAKGIKVTNDLLGLPQFDIPFSLSFFAFPLLIIFSFLQKIKDRNELFFRKNQIVAALFFLITLFLFAARITDIGTNFYASLFKIPGFGMFRTFGGQFVIVFSFFYSILISFSLYTLYLHKKKIINVSITLLLFIILIIRGIPLLDGSMLYLPIFQSKVSSPYVIPPAYENAWHYIANQQNNLKILTLPLTDFGYQLLGGKDGGMYIGPSTIGILTQKEDFTGYTVMGSYGNVFLQAVKNHDESTIINLLSIFDVGNIFWDKTPILYGNNFPTFPYNTTKNYIPTTIMANKSFINSLPISNVVNFGSNIQYFSLNHSITLPRIFLSTFAIYSPQPEDTPFLIHSPQVNPTIVLPLSNYSPYIGQNSFEATIQNELSGLNDNLQFHEAIPEVSWEPGTFMYPFVLWKEQRSINKLQGEDRMTYSFLFMAKRIKELDKWGSDLSLNGTPVLVNQSLFNQILDFHAFSNWGAVLSIYENYANSLIQFIKSEPLDMQISEKVIASEQFAQHQERIQTIIDNSDLTVNKKKYLSDLCTKMFSRLETSLDLEKINVVQQKFLLSLPETAKGNYSIILSHIDPRTQYIGLTINDKQLNPISISKDTVSFGNISLASQNSNSISLQEKPENLADETTWKGMGYVKTDEGIDSLYIDSLVHTVTESALSKEINLFPMSQQYVISFYYKTDNLPFTLSISDRRLTDQGSSTVQEYSTKILQSKDWKLYQTVLTTDPQTLSLFIEIKNSSEGETKRIDIKDLDVTPVEEPILTFNNTDVGTNPLPHVIFQRINLTKYKVNISDARNPYVLTLLEGYSPNWKLYISKASKNKDESATVATYLNGIVEEKKQKNTFWDSDLLMSWVQKPIADSTHTEGYGYANSWVIKPEDVGKKSNYTLVIEYIPQRNFYIGIVVTSVAILVTLIASILIFVRKLRK